MEHTVEEVRNYWDSHLNLTQFLTPGSAAIGSDDFYGLLEASLTRYEYKEQLLKNFAKDSKGQKLLEVGCGLGIELAKLGKLGFNVTGIDLAPTGVELCNQYLRRQNITGKAFVQDAEQVEFADETFDAVYSSGVLQHTPNIERAIDEIWRVTKRGGRILVILYHRHSWFYFLQKISGINIEFESKDAPIINAYTEKGLKTLFSAFRDLHIKCEYYYPHLTRRKGALASLFNRLFVPAVNLIPARAIQRYGWHLVLTGVK